MPKYTYRPARGGHASGHLRELLCAYVETGEVDADVLYDPSVLGGRDPVEWLCGQLWSCTDLLPCEVRDELGYDVDTYARAVRLLRSQHRHAAAQVARR